MDGMNEYGLWGTVVANSSNRRRETRVDRQILADKGATVARCICTLTACGR